MDNYYDPEILKRIQSVELDMLKDFDALCEKYQIEYFGVGGTTIGLLRHQGYIPWDDDIDIGMLREDYDRFLAVAEREYGEKYSLLNFEKNPDYPLMTTRWVKNGTTFLEHNFRNIDANWGIFLDLFCFDNIPDDDRAFKKQGFWAWVWSKLLILRSVPFPVLEQTGFVKYCIWAGCAVLHFLIRLFHIPAEFFYKKAHAQATKYQNAETSRVSYMFDPALYTSVMEKKDVLPTKRRAFEGMQVKFACNVEKYCRERYGDYMKMPPVEKRHNHVPYRLDFGDNEAQKISW
ncbi:MAG: LicD family protein [Lachnospiraceae bacterium]|nr:LicD family protein [Lachnospiraceae bacterium]